MAVAELINWIATNLLGLSGTAVVALWLILAFFYFRKAKSYAGVAGNKLQLVVVSAAIIGALTLLGVIDLNPDVAVRLAGDAFQLAADTLGGAL